MKVSESNKSLATKLVACLSPILGCPFAIVIMTASHIPISLSTGWLLLAVWWFATSMAFGVGRLTIWFIDFREQWSRY